MTKDKRFHLIIVAQAVLITVLFHLLLLFGFSESSEKQIEETVAYRRISLLPTSGNGEMAPARITPWMEYNDPTLIAKPNDRYGYGHLLAAHGWRPNLDAFGPVAPARRPAFAASGWTSPENSAANDIRPMNDWLAALGRYPVRPLSSSPVNYPRVFNRAGTEVLRGAFDRVMPDIAQEFKRLPPVSATVLQLTTAGAVDDERLPRYQIRSSSGNRQLDLLALRVIMAQDDLGDQAQLTVAWPMVLEVRK